MKVNALHTPGPWHASPASETTSNIGVYDASGFNVATLHITSQVSAARRGKDALLIAAAPDLLAALQWVLAEHNDGYGLRCEAIVRSAIDKATGSPA